jgi:hypothetical protein
MRTLFLLLACPAFAFAQPREVAPMPKQVFPGEAMIESYFRGQVKQIADNCLNDLTTKEAWEKRRPELRKQFLEMVGLWPLPARTDLKATITGKVEGDGYTVEKLHFQSMPGLYVTANFYLPKSDKPLKGLPTILYVCGHGNVVEDKVSYGSKCWYQYHPAWFARNGYACIILDTLELGEIPGEHHGTYKLNQWWWQTRGYTPAGVELWNAMRALDYLETRPEVDAKKIGVTGRSGGGATSWWLVAGDDRPACYAPIAGIVDLQSHLCEGGVGERLKKGVIAGHCDCMFMVNKYRWDFPMVAALAAPRPVLLGNSDVDEIFPVAGYRRLADKVSKVYALYDKEGANKFQLLETKGPHKDTPELRHGINAWMNRYLKGQPNLPIDDELPAKLKPQDLKVFAKLPEDAINANIQELFIKPVVIELPKSVEVAKAWWPQKQKELMKGLETECFAGWSKEEWKPFSMIVAIGISGKSLFRSCTFTSETDVILFMDITHTSGAAPEKGIILMLPTVNRSLETTNNFHNVSTVYRGMLRDQWAKPGSPEDVHIRRRFALIGQTLDGQRVWDVRRTIQAIRAQEPYKTLPIRIHAKGEAAGIALYAALFENVDELVLEDLPTSHWDGPIFLNVAKVLDMPQAVALAASKVKSVHLRVKTEKEKAAWEWATELQRLTGEKSLTITVIGQ